MSLRDLSGDPGMRATLCKAAIVAGVPLLALALLVAPAWTRAADARADLARAAADLEWLVAVTQRHSGRPVAAVQPMPGTVDLERILQDNGLRPALSQLTEQGGDRLLLTLNEADFQRVVGFLHALETAHAGALQEVSIRRGKPGYAAATLVIQGAPE